MPQSHEALGSGSPVSLIERWNCQVEACRNYGQLCYYAVSDTADEHLPVHSIVMQSWLAAISRGECTVDVPPREILEKWQLQNLRSLQRREERRDARAARKVAAHKPSVPTSKSTKSAKSKA